jgi:hypothetical protein
LYENRLPIFAFKGKAHWVPKRVLGKKNARNLPATLLNVSRGFAAKVQQVRFAAEGMCHKEAEKAKKNLRRRELRRK